MFKRTTADAVIRTAESADSRFFTKSAMRAFSSKLYPESVHVDESGTRFVFITSEKQSEFYDWQTGEVETYPRRYTVRVGTLTDYGNPDGRKFFTIDDDEQGFQGYKSLRSARKALAEYVATH